MLLFTNYLTYFIMKPKINFSKTVKMNIEPKRMAGESLERFIGRMTSTNQPIEATSPIIYTERKDGVLPQYDIRTDRWEIAQATMSAAAKSDRAKREERIKAAEQPTEQPTE
ncbi:hypothetical protein [Microvirus sp.]|nr:hypothetical protein [Microvirus sp.]